MQFIVKPSATWDGVFPLAHGHSLSREQADRLLDSGQLYACMASGAYWLLRRNGETRTWKTRPGEYSIPVKAGLKSCARFMHDWRAGDHFTVEEK